MTDLLLHLRLTGVIMAGLVVLNVLAPRHFAWPEHLRGVEPLTRNVFVVHHLFIALIVELFAVLLLGFPWVLLERSGAAVALLVGMLVFWAVRLFAQWFVYDASLWRGDRFRTRAHVVINLVLVYLLGVFGWGLFVQLTALHSSQGGV